MPSEKLIAWWSDAMRQIALQTLSGVRIGDDGTITTGDKAGVVRDFHDERGNRRGIDPPLLASVLGIGCEPEAGHRSPEVEAWWRLVAGDELLSSFEPGPGPLLPPADIAVEVQTEVELCSLHALWNSGGSPAIERSLSAARWHLEHTQPDNATNTPWAIHVFVELAARDKTHAGAAVIHAEFMLSACQVLHGRPDARSAWVLLDAAKQLRRSAEDQTV